MKAQGEGTGDNRRRRHHAKFKLLLPADLLRSRFLDCWKVGRKERVSHLGQLTLGEPVYAEVILGLRILVIVHIEEPVRTGSSGRQPTEDINAILLAMIPETGHRHRK